MFLQTNLFVCELAIDNKIKLSTGYGMDLFHTTYSPCPIISPDPDHEFVPSSSGHLVEELQALFVSLGV